ncbi:hypothetical protein OIU85_010098 [Salix viminalis]|uniref:Uncharacterized protein n=1 Tax=Salix viminalis TaxID=40686 RepID=A0A9Q0NVW9_SALVM|nr:hypothetical protein OIU85_010098 [Salix viminalis]
MSVGRGSENTLLAINQWNLEGFFWFMKKKNFEKERYYGVEERESREREKWREGGRSKKETDEHPASVLVVAAVSFGCHVGGGGGEKESSFVRLCGEGSSSGSDMTWQW